MNKADKERYDLLVQIGCIVCQIHKNIYTMPQIHHPWGRTKDGNQKTIPLCYYHHQEGSDCPEYTSRHPWKTRFVQRYGTEESLLEETNIRIERLIEGQI